jgi:hypothetical protein
MSIGRIPSAAKTPPQAAASGVATTGSGAPFESEKAEAAAPIAPCGPLAEFKAGNLDRAGYIDAHVAQATTHLGALPAAAQESVRAQLRERCETDPVLMDLITKSTSADSR